MQLYLFLQYRENPTGVLHSLNIKVQFISEILRTLSIVNSLTMYEAQKALSNQAALWLIWVTNFNLKQNLWKGNLLPPHKISNHMDSY